MTVVIFTEGGNSSRIITIHVDSNTVNLFLCNVPFFFLTLHYIMQVGEAKLVLEIGHAALQRRNSKPYIHDITLSMALSEVRSKKQRLIHFVRIFF